MKRLCMWTLVAGLCSCAASDPDNFRAELVHVVYSGVLNSTTEIQVFIGPLGDKDAALDVIQGVERRLGI